MTYIFFAMYFAHRCTSTIFPKLIIRIYPCINDEEKKIFNYILKWGNLFSDVRKLFNYFSCTSYLAYELLKCDFVYLVVILGCKFSRLLYICINVCLSVYVCMYLCMNMYVSIYVYVCEWITHEVPLP